METTTPGVTPAVPYTLERVFEEYRRDITIPNGGDSRRVDIIARHIFDFLPRDADPEKLTKGHFRDYVAFRRGQGVSNPTIRRELAILFAALRHGSNEDRYKFVMKFKAPPPGEPRKRFLSIEEKQRVMLQPMSARLRMFFILAFATAARAKAIEELKWGQVDWKAGMIDYHVPGTRRTKKRRAIVPMSKALRPRLESAYARRKDEFVIGAGPSTYAEAKKVMIAAGINERGVARHVARKTFASHAVQKGIPYAHIGGVLGDTAATTERSYGFLRPKDLLKAVNHEDMD